MSPDGMREVTQPSALFLAERPEGASGSVVAATSEGARSLLVEVQALVGGLRDWAHRDARRRVSTRLDLRCCSQCWVDVRGSMLACVRTRS